MVSRIPTGLVLGGLLAVAVSSAGAHQLLAPAEVQADASGQFSYEAVLIVSSPVAYGSGEIDGRDNTDLGWAHFDGFCMVVRQPGSYPWTIAGKLADPSHNGSVRYREALCDGWEGEVTTLILAPVVPLDTATWSTVKAMYR